MLRLGLVLLCLLSGFTAIAQDRPPAPDPVIVMATKARLEGRVADAEKILTDAVSLAEQTAPESPRLALYLVSLANLYEFKNQYPGALVFAQRALDLDRQLSGPSGIPASSDVCNVAGILLKLGKSAEAERLLRQAIESVRQEPEPHPLASAMLLNSLPSLYNAENRPTEAETLIDEALKECESLRQAEFTSASFLCRSLPMSRAEVYRKEGRPFELLPPTFRPNPVPMPAELDRLDQAAQQYMKDKLYVQAEITYKQIIAWIEQNPKTEIKSPVHIVQNWFNRLPSEYEMMGRALEAQGLLREAEESYKKAIELKESIIDPKQPLSAASFNYRGLLNLYRQQGRLNEMEPVLQHVLDVQQKYLGNDNTHVADTSLTFANLYSEEGRKDETKYAAAVPLYERALTIRQANLGPDNPQLLPVLTPYVNALHAVHDEAKAAELRSRIDAIRKKSETQDRRD